MGFAPTPNCPSRKMTVSFSQADIMPAEGYLVKWQVKGSNTWEEKIVYSSPTDILVPSCETIVISVQAKCGPFQLGTANVVEEPPSQTFSASLQQVSCSNGAGVFNLTGTPGQTIVLKLIVDGSMQYASGGPGTCAWVSGQISASGLATTGGLSNSITSGTGQITFNELILTVNLPLTGVNAGKAVINTQVVGHNVQSVNTFSATLFVYSVNNIVVSGTNTSQTLCKISSSTAGCLVNTTS